MGGDDCLYFIQVFIRFFSSVGGICSIGSSRTELYYNSGHCPMACEVHAILQYNDKMGFTGNIVIC